MKELIELLNHTSGTRVFFYSVVFLIALMVTLNFMYDVIVRIFKK